jgi:hypothetical protein
MPRWLTLIPTMLEDQWKSRCRRKSTNAKPYWSAVCHDPPKEVVLLYIQLTQKVWSGSNVATYKKADIVGIIFPYSPQTFIVARSKVPDNQGRNLRRMVLTKSW